MNQPEQMERLASALEAIRDFERAGVEPLRIARLVDEMTRRSQESADRPSEWSVISLSALAINRALLRIKGEPDLWWHCGFGTETFDRLIAAYCAITGMDHEQAVSNFQGDATAAAPVLMKRIRETWLRYQEEKKARPTVAARQLLEELEAALGRGR